MMKISYRLVIFSIVFLFGVVLSIPSLFNTEKGPKINLGLDLQGGMYLLLGVKYEDAIKSKLKSIASSINYISKKDELYIDDIEVKDNKITFTLPDKDDEKTIDKFFKDIKGLSIKKNIKDDSVRYIVSLTPKEIQLTKQNALSQAIQTIKSRLDQFGLAEPTVAKQGTNILVELPGIKTQKEEQRARELISKSAHLELMVVDDDLSPDVSPQKAKEYGDIVLPDSKNPNIHYVVKSIPILDGSKLTDARVSFDQSNQPVIEFSLNSEGSQIFADFTEKNVGKKLAIVLDNKVYSAPTIQERIGGGHGQISGGFSVEEAHDISIALRSGSLPAPVVLLEKRSVGPSLGADSIKQSMIALISGFLIVVIFMVIYYKTAGLVANIALIANLFLIVAVMALLHATLTLPGMAGIVLTVGMAVDANVIINERIRELLREGKSIKKAIEGGYQNAMSAILDANITTLIAAFALYAYGTGTIKGFAVTMAIGILASMLTAILGTHGIWEYLVSRNKVTIKSFGIRK